jgi:DNA-binding response OmpR family regulator
MAEEAGVEPTEDACAPSNGFEARAPHRERYSSAAENAPVWRAAKGASGAAAVRNALTSAAYKTSQARIAGRGAMADNGPKILVVAGDGDERLLIAAMLCEAGFAVVAATAEPDAMAALRHGRFAAAVIALAPDNGVALVRTVRQAQPGLPALLVLEPAAMRLIDEDCATIVKRPFDPRRLLGCVFELVLRDDEPHDSRLGHIHAAELGIAAARLACLCNRRAIAAAAGASRLAQELTRQIGDLRTIHGGLGGFQADDPAVDAWAG